MSSAPREFETPVSTRPVEGENAAPRPTAMERFLESFLQERNIKWMLGIGVLILLGSSLMFVKSHWDNMQETYKYLVLLGYTGLIHLCGQVAYHKLNLRKTGTALMAVTLLLIPLVFFSLHWVTGSTAVQTAGLAFALLIAVAFSALAARRVFRHFLRGDQPAVLVCYLSLSVLGAIAGMLPGVEHAVAGPLWALAVWALFAFGSVKANREVFWMAEEHRLPRIFGFFPIALFGLQFLAIFAEYFAGSFETDWFGVGLVLTAIPVMLTADAFATVFKQRTGDLVRPLPWSIIGPIVVGLVLSIAGLLVAATGMPRPYALVPAAVVFAVMMGLTAHRTGQRGFAWAMLFGTALAYQFAPVFFLDLVLHVRDAAATALNESPKRLPYAYYGLTYMPLLMACSLLARWRKRVADDDVFTPVLRHFTLGASVVLFSVSFSHAGANFLVASAMVVFFLWQAFVYERREAAGFAIIAMVTAAVQVVPFLSQVWHLSFPLSVNVFALGLVAFGMQLAGPRLDRMLDLHTTSESKLARWFTSWQAAARPVTLGAVGWWLVGVLPNYHHTPALWSGLLLTGLLGIQAMVSPRKGFGEVTVCLSLLLFGVHSAAIDLLSASGLVLAYAVAFIGLWGFGRLTDNRTDRFAIAFSSAAHRVSHLSVLMAIGTGAYSVACGFGHVPFVMEIAFSSVIATVWCLAEGRRKPALLALGFISLLASECGIVNEFLSWRPDDSWIPVAWAVTSFAALRHSRRDDNRLLEALSLGTLGLLALGSFVFFTVPMTVAGAVATAGFVTQSLVSENRSLRGCCLVAMNWQLVALVLRLACGDVTTVFHINTHHLLQAALPLAAVMAVSSVLFHHPRLVNLSGRDSVIGIAEIFDAHFWALSSAAVALLAFSMGLSVLGPADAACAAIAFTALGTSTLLSAFQSRKEAGVWAAVGIAAFGLVYFYVFEIIQVGLGVSMFVVLGLALVSAVLARLMARRESTAFATRPFTMMARVLPMGTVGIAFARYASDPNSGWLGMKSLAVFLSAAYYFWCGVEEKRNNLIVLAAGIVNFALILLWQDLQLKDPQFFMIPIGVSILGVVELLKREIPNAMRNPLRYAGALMILVSPTFHIVGGSWLHVFSLMVCAIAVSLVAIGLRIRPLLYAGTAFLVADLIAMVVFGVKDHPDLLWLVGLGAGAAVIALAAFFENQRANVMSRMRLLAAELDTWE